MLQRQRNNGARKRRERGRARHAAQTASERQATLQRKVPMNTKQCQLKPLKRDLKIPERLPPDFTSFTASRAPESNFFAVANNGIMVMAAHPPA